jgi:hypothetical protein
MRGITGFTMGVCLVLFQAVVLCGVHGLEEGLPVVPGAAGFGITTPAGTGRHTDPSRTRVIKVTNLNTEGPGSLQAALAAKGPRVVVFEVGGNIDFTPYGSLTIPHPYVTVAGQTAPSPGITLKGCQIHVRASNVLLQHIRVRTGDLRDPGQPVKKKSGWTQWSERDCMKVGGDRVVVDHCSFSWATDENVQTRGNELTFRHCIFSEALDSARHHKGGHSRGLLIMNQGRAGTRNEGQKVAVIGNLFAHNKGRNPTAGSGTETVIVNNLIDDANFAIKGDDAGRTGYQLLTAKTNVIRRTNSPFVARGKRPGTRFYFAPDHLVNGKTYDSVEALWEEAVLMPFEPGVGDVQRAQEPPITLPGLNARPTDEVMDWVLGNAGARPSDRDPVDARVVKSVREKTGRIIASQEDVGGWPELKETHRKLSVPEHPNSDDDGDGYTNLEEWLHGYARAVE